MDEWVFTFRRSSRLRNKFIERRLIVDIFRSHELQTCDWPRNVGCGAASVESSEASSVTQSAPSAPSIQRTRQQIVQNNPPPPPPPRASPNPVVTSRGQPTHINHQQIVKVIILRTI